MADKTTKPVLAEKRAQLKEKQGEVALMEAEVAGLEADTLDDLLAAMTSQGFTNARQKLAAAAESLGEGPARLTVSSLTMSLSRALTDLETHRDGRRRAAGTAPADGG